MKTLWRVCAVLFGLVMIAIGADNLGFRGPIYAYQLVDPAWLFWRAIGIIGIIVGWEFVRRHIRVHSSPIQCRHADHMY